jgi:hypothetical protein
VGEAAWRDARAAWEERMHRLRQEGARRAVEEGLAAREEEAPTQVGTAAPKDPPSPSPSLPCPSTFVSEPPPPSLPSEAVFQDPIRQMQLVLGRPPSLEDVPWLDASGLLPLPPPPSPPPSLETWIDAWVSQYWREADRTYQARHPPSRRRKGRGRGRPRSLREWREEEAQEMRRRGGRGRWQWLRCWGGRLKDDTRGEGGEGVGDWERGSIRAADQVWGREGREGGGERGILSPACVSRVAHASF